MFSFLKTLVIYTGIGYAITYVGTNILNIPLPPGLSTVFIAGFAIFLWVKAMSVVRAIIRMVIFSGALIGFYAFLQNGLDIDVQHLFSDLLQKLSP